MQAAELVELAALLAANGASILGTDMRASPTSLEQYWSASKCRLDRWHRSLRDYRDQNEFGPAGGAATRWRRLRPIVEEILTGEVLARVWAGLMTASDRLHGTDQGEPITRSVLIGHMEASNRTLSLVVHAGLDPRQALAIHRLRRRAERWTDLLIGYLISFHDVSSFAPNPDRAQEFASDLQHQQQFQGGRHSWPLVLASLRAAMARGFSGASPNTDLNARIAGSILAGISPLAFDSTGVMRSLWLVRLANVADDTQGMIAGLLLEDAPTMNLTERRGDSSDL